MVGGQLLHLVEDFVLFLSSAPDRPWYLQASLLLSASVSSGCQTYHLKVLL